MSKCYLCKCRLKDMNYAEFEAFALIEISPNRAHDLVGLAYGIKAPILWLAVNDQAPQWFRDVDLDELNLAVDLDMDEVYPLTDDQVSLVREAEALDASGVYAEVTPHGVTWAADLDNDEERATTAQVPLDLLVRIDNG